jgi:hypothetical protein
MSYVSILIKTNIFTKDYSLLSLIFEMFVFMLSDWVSFLAYPNLFGIKGFVVVVVVVVYKRYIINCNQLRSNQALQPNRLTILGDHPIKLT